MGHLWQSGSLFSGDMLEKHWSSGEYPFPCPFQLPTTMTRAVCVYISYVCVCVATLGLASKHANLLYLCNMTSNRGM